MREGQRASPGHGLHASSGHGRLAPARRAAGRAPRHPRHARARPARARRRRPPARRPAALRNTTYAIFHPDGVRQAMATEADRYRKDNVFYEEIRWALGDGLLNSRDERWLRQRRFIQPLFTCRRIAGYAEAMGEEAEVLPARWRAAGDTIDLHAEMSRVTLRIVGRLLFGALLAARDREERLEDSEIRDQVLIFLL